jgi:hypothetical protein
MSTQSERTRPDNNQFGPALVWAAVLTSVDKGGRGQHTARLAAPARTIRIHLWRDRDEFAMRRSPSTGPRAGQEGAQIGLNGIRARAQKVSRPAGRRQNSASLIHCFAAQPPAAQELRHLMIRLNLIKVSAKQWRRPGGSESGRPSATCSITRLRLVCGPRRTG